MSYKTDLAMEAYSLFCRDTKRVSALPGVKARQWKRANAQIASVEIIDQQGARALGKPKGRYITLAWADAAARQGENFSSAAQELARQIRTFLDEPSCVLAAGLGNEAITPDALGPWAIDNLIVTRHLKARHPGLFSSFCSVAAVRPGVLAQSGMEALELVRAAAVRVRPQWVIVMDALAAADAGRICSTIQLTDAGIAPGSGLGNSRAAFTKQALGVRVLAIGVPTLMDAGNLPNGGKEGMIVTPRDADARVREMARLVGYGVNLALHPKLSVSEVAHFLT